jgi:hypothetical protein
LRILRGLIVATLVILIMQGWFGDFVTVFVAPASGIRPPSPSVTGFLHELQSLPTPFFPLWHAFEGLALIALGLAVVVFAFVASRSRGVRIWAIVGLVAVLSAALGGLRFVGSGFATGGDSMQMGGSYIGAFASYFLSLYHTK